MQEQMTMNNHLFFPSSCQRLQMISWDFEGQDDFGWGSGRLGFEKDMVLKCLRCLEAQDFDGSECLFRGSHQGGFEEAVGVKGYLMCLEPLDFECFGLENSFQGSGSLSLNVYSHSIMVNFVQKMAKD